MYAGVGTTTGPGSLNSSSASPTPVITSAASTTWSGSTSGVRELPQSFETFGGWGAGALNALVRTPGGEMIVGSWEGRTGLDISVWTPKGRRWVRQPTTAGSQRGAR